MLSKICFHVSQPPGFDMIMKVYAAVSTTLLKVRNNVIYICIGLPLRTLSLFLQAQLFLLRVPLKIVNTIFNWIMRTVQWPSHSCPSRTEQLQSVLGCNEDDTAAVLNAMKEIRMTSMTAVSKMNSFNCEFEKYRKRFDDWKRESERKTNALFVIASEEKKLMKVIVGALKHLRKLKSTREMMDQKFNNYVEGLVNLSKDVYKQTIPAAEENNERLKNCFNILRQETEQFKSVVEAKIQSNNLEVAESNIYGSSPKIGLTPKLNSIQDSRLLNITMETLQSVLSLLMVENVQLKKRLSITNSKLEEVINMLKILSEEIVSLSQKFGEMIRLNNKIFDLQNELQRAKELLHSAETDRDDMRLKLLTLKSMIEEEEDYLNCDDANFLDDEEDYTDDDSVSSDCMNTSIKIKFCECDNNPVCSPMDSPKDDSI